MRILITSIITLIIISCTRDNPAVVLVNQSEIIIDSTEIFATESDKLIFRNIDVDITKLGNISFNEVPKNDGSYQVIVYKDGKIFLQRPFGYYTNGASLNNSFDIYLKPDSIIIESD